MVGKHKLILAVFCLQAHRSRGYSEDGEVHIQLDQPCDEITEFLDKVSKLYIILLHHVTIHLVLHSPVATIHVGCNFNLATMLCKQNQTE